MTNKMLEVLIAIRHQPARRIFGDGEGKPPWPHGPSTLAALTRNGFVTRSERLNRVGHPLTEWTITDKGRDALKPRERLTRDAPLYLARPGSIRYRTLPSGRVAVDDNYNGNADYTSDPHRSIDTDLAPFSRVRMAVEVLVEPADLARFAAKAASTGAEKLKQKAEALDKMTPEQRIDNLAKHGDGIQNETRLVRFLLKSGRQDAALRKLEALEAGTNQRAA